MPVGAPGSWRAIATRAVAIVDCVFGTAFSFFCCMGELDTWSDSIWFRQSSSPILVSPWVVLLVGWLVGVLAIAGGVLVGRSVFRRGSLRVLGATLAGVSCAVILALHLSESEGLSPGGDRLGVADVALNVVYAAVPAAVLAANAGAIFLRFPRRTGAVTADD